MVCERIRASKREIVLNVPINNVFSKNRSKKSYGSKNKDPSQAIAMC